MKMNNGNEKSLEQEFKEKYIKDLTSWILFHRMMYELSTTGYDMNYFDGEAVVVKMDIPSVLKVVQHLYETDKESLDKLYFQSVDEISHLKDLVNRMGGCQ